MHREWSHEVMWQDYLSIPYPRPPPRKPFRRADQKGLTRKESPPSPHLSSSPLGRTRQKGAPHLPNHPGTSFKIEVFIKESHFYRPPSEGWGKVIVSVCSDFGGGGGYPIQPWMGGGGFPCLRFLGGVPGLRFWGGVPGLRFLGGVPGLRFLGGSQVSDFWGGGYPVWVKGKIFDTRFGLIHVQTGKKFFVEGPPPSKGKNFWHQIWLDTCSDWEKNFLSRDPPPPVKGKIFDTRFGLIHVQTGKKFFVEGPPPSKRKNFWHQIWLDTCSDWENNFLSRDPPPSKGKNFWHQIWLDTCSDWEKKFLSRDPPPPSKGKIFWHQIWLDTCSDCKKNLFGKGLPPPPPPGIARNCYGHAVGGMPLAFTQEDFLVVVNV